MTLTVESAAPASDRRRRLLALLAVVAGLSLLVGGRALWRDYQNRSPYGPAVVGARVSLTVVSAPQAGELLDTLVGAGKETPVYPGATTTVCVRTSSAG